MVTTLRMTIHKLFMTPPSLDRIADFAVKITIGLRTGARVDLGQDRENLCVRHSSLIEVMRMRANRFAASQVAEINCSVAGKQMIQCGTHGMSWRATTPSMSVFEPSRVRRAMNPRFLGT